MSLDLEPVLMVGMISLVVGAVAIIRDPIGQAMAAKEAPKELRR